MTLSLRISRFVALFGSVLTAVQVGLLLIGDDGICFNDGCHVVDSMTTISPLWFNIGGFVFFQCLFWGMKYVTKEGWYLGLLRLIMLGAVVAEGVLVSFQYFVANVFCSYCLIVLGLIVLLNLLNGVRQIISGIAVFAAVVIAFSTLQFDSIQDSLLDSLHTGSYAAISGRDEESRYLFFSSSCPHCEKILATLDGAGFAVYFNPIDEITDFPIPGARKNPQYDYKVNRKLLKVLGLEEVPALLIYSETEYKIITGSEPIADYFQSCLRSPEPDDISAQQNSSDQQAYTGTGQSSSQSSSTSNLLPPAQNNGTCSVLEDCK